MRLPTFLLVVLVAAFTALSFHPALAAGSIVPFSCEKGEFLVGFDGRVGAWIDNFRPICARWNGDRSGLGAPRPGPRFGFSNGGEIFSVLCPKDQAIHEIKFGMAHPGGGDHLQNMYMTCYDLRSVTNSGVQKVILSDNFATNFERHCYEGEMPTGLLVSQGDGEINNLYFGLNNVREFCRDAQTVKREGAPAIDFDVARDRMIEPKKDDNFHLARNRLSQLGVPGSSVVEGVWKTSEGEVTFTSRGDDLTGSYGNGSTLYLQRLSGDMYSGNWVQTKSEQACPRQKHDSDFWGIAHFTFSDQNRHFEGQWTYCARQAPPHSWTGDRIK